MKKVNLYIAVLFVFCNCAGVKFYEDPSLSKRKGLEFYSPKPYLIVERNPAKDVAIKSSIIYLPDKSDPTYIKNIRGLGSHALNVTMQNGILTTFGNTSDSKIPETITSLTGLVTGLDSILKKDKTEDNNPALLDTEENTVKEAKNELGKIIADLKKQNFDHLTTNQVEVKNKIAIELEKIHGGIDPANRSDLSGIVNQLKKEFKNLNNLVQDLPTDHIGNAKIKQLQKELYTIINKLAPPQQPNVEVEVYEIKITQKGTTLEKVNIVDFN